MRNLTNNEAKNIVGGCSANEQYPASNQSPVGEWEEIWDDILNGRRPGWENPENEYPVGG